MPGLLLYLMMSFKAEAHSAFWPRYINLLSYLEHEKYSESVFKKMQVIKRQ